MSSMSWVLGVMTVALMGGLLPLVETHVVDEMERKMVPPMELMLVGFLVAHEVSMKIMAEMERKRVLPMELMSAGFLVAHEVSMKIMSMMLILPRRALKVRIQWLLDL